LNITQTQSTSVHLAAIKGDVATGIKVVYDALVQCCSSISETPVTIGLRFDNRVLPQPEEGFKDIQLRSTNIKDIINKNEVYTGSRIINVHDIIGSEICVASEDGQKVYVVIKAEFSKGNAVNLSFENVKNISPIFIYSALCQLYNGDFSEEDLKN
jgi:hypothetical protein